MKGLLLKDWYQIKSNMKTMYLTVLAVLVIWTLSASGASTFAMNYAAIFLGILPVSLLAYDHSSGWTERRVMRRDCSAGKTASRCPG